MNLDPAIHAEIIIIILYKVREEHLKIFIAT